MTTLSKSQQAILDLLLKSDNGATADELVDDLGITKTAVKSHLDTLVNRDLLTFVDEKSGVGRPRRRYRLSETATEAFPKQYSWLSTQLLKELSRTLEPSALRSLMRRLAERVYSENKAHLSDPDPKVRLNRLGGLMNDLGYKAKILRVGRDSKVTIEAYNCVYHDVAKAHPELCEFDRYLINQATQMPTTLESCIAKGGACCRFRLG